MTCVEAIEFAEADQRSAQDGSLMELIAAIMGLRHRRSQLFGRELFTDHAWDILLVLLKARIEKRTLTLPEVAQSVDISSSSCARWLAVLEDRGLVMKDAEEEGSYALSAHCSSCFRRLTDIMSEDR